MTEREKTLSCKILKPKIPTGVRDRLKWTRSEVVENALVTRGKEKFKCRKAFEVGLIDTGGIFERGGLWISSHEVLQSTVNTVYHFLFFIFEE